MVNRNSRGLLIAILLTSRVRLLAHAQETGAKPGPENVVPAVTSPSVLTRPGDKRVSLISDALAEEEWIFFSGKTDATLQQTWRVDRDPASGQLILVCTGDPQGYLRTRQSFAEFEMGVEWRYPKDQEGNSGVFLFTTGEDRIWPTGVQVQLHQPSAGSVFPSGAAKADNELRNVPSLAKPINQWNSCKITSQGGRVSVTVNGTKVGEVSGCSPHVGAIALQSEGSEVHFRSVWVRPLGEEKLAAPPTTPNVSLRAKRRWRALAADACLDPAVTLLKEGPARTKKPSDAWHRVELMVAGPK